MKLEIILTEEDLKQLIITELKNKLGEIPFNRLNVSIKVKSKQNYKAEWEEALFKAEYVANI